jgi:uncharacterized membrane protein
MSKQILNDLEELTAAGVIGTAESDRIRAYYVNKSTNAPNRLVLIFAVLGALLTGLGIVLIIAHNWDDFTRAVKIFFALLPLAVGQLLSAFALLKHRDNRVWCEATSVFLFFAIAASISIVSQVYNIPGSLSGFLLVWMMVSIPIVYIMRSSMTSLLILCGITTYACTLSYFDYPIEIAWYYWLMLGTLIPHYVLTLSRGRSAFLNFHRWFIAISVVITLNMFNQSGNWVMLVGYFSLFCLLIMLGEMERAGGAKGLRNPFFIIGSLGVASLLIGVSFRFVWDDIARQSQWIDEAYFAALFVTTVAAGVLIFTMKRVGKTSVNPNAFIFIVFIVVVALGTVQPSLAQWSVNLLILAMAVLTTRRGVEQNSMVVLNYGLLIMAVLILCRFFDTDMSFVVRGILFLIVGASFFGANYLLLKRRKIQNL